MKYSLTRIAPTPSGFLHLGNAFSFLLTKTLAQRHGAKILLRIDDLDRERYRPEYVQDIFDTLDFLEIQIDLGPKSLSELESEWSQVHRMKLYEEALEALKHSGKVFSCDCSRNKIQQMDSRGYYLGLCLDRKIPLDRPETAWRVNTLDSDFLTFTEYPEMKKTYLIPEETAFYIVRKKDKLPAYHLTSVVDDLHFGVDLIIRGKDLYPSTLAQLDLARLLNQPMFGATTFLHHEVIKGPNQAKLSKSAGSLSVQSLRKEGKNLEDIKNLIRSLSTSEIFKPYENLIF
ncbi:glutamate--tRNA ligase family protein [Algoriphagus sp. AK58]|uniref:glutamate--tRNA ligase family protein n=1 Tax=Algoriphagus sp. AK58 TaxID=1406877 RepID=UPI00164F7916|nr:glutamate--tRNA ligase family protein [Algoriphagus sp. AK58]MBC6367803.1 tRNA glutamyl-Q synthetase [Algoriphagus sp. AK58]